MRYQNGKALKDSVPLSVVGYIIPMECLILPHQNAELCLDFRLHQKAKRVFLPNIWYLPTQSTERAHVDKSRVQRLYNASLSPPSWSSLRCQRHLGDRPPDPFFHSRQLTPGGTDPTVGLWAECPLRKLWRWE